MFGIKRLITIISLSLLLSLFSVVTHAEQPSPTVRLSLAELNLFEDYFNRNHSAESASVLMADLNNDSKEEMIVIESDQSGSNSSFITFNISIVVLFDKGVARIDTIRIVQELFLGFEWERGFQLFINYGTNGDMLCYRDVFAQYGGCNVSTTAYYYEDITQKKLEDSYWVNLDEESDYVDEEGKPVTLFENIFTEPEIPASFERPQGSNIVLSSYEDTSIRPYAKNSILFARSCMHVEGSDNDAVWDNINQSRPQSLIPLTLVGEWKYEYGNGYIVTLVFRRDGTVHCTHNYKDRLVEYEGFVQIHPSADYFYFDQVNITSHFDNYYNANEFGTPEFDDESWEGYSYILEDEKLAIDLSKGTEGWINIMVLLRQ